MYKFVVRMSPSKTETEYKSVCEAFRAKKPLDTVFIVLGEGKDKSYYPVLKA